MSKAEYKERIQTAMNDYFRSKGGKKPRATKPETRIAHLDSCCYCGEWTGTDNGTVRQGEYGKEIVCDTCIAIGRGVKTEQQPIGSRARAPLDCQSPNDMSS